MEAARLVRDRNYRSRSQRLCRPHASGVPVYLQGRRFYKPGCATCEDNAKAGKVSRKDPLPEALHKKWYKAHYSAYRRGFGR